MGECDRAAMSRGTMTAGIDLEQVRAARDALAALREDIPDPAPAAEPVRVSTMILAGLLIGALVWLVR